MAQFNFYPHFVPDQVLTDTHLNNLFNYLDEQNRYTRNKLLGIGIVCGLEATLSSNTITVSKGVGITSAGYLIHIAQTQLTAIKNSNYTFPDDFIEIQTDYTYNYNKPGWVARELVSVVTDASKETLLSADLTVLNNKVLVLLLEKKSEDLKNCTNNDCDDKGENVNFTIRFLLVEKTSIAQNASAITNNALSTLPFPHLKRFNIPFSSITSPQTLYNKFLEVAKDTTLLNNLQDGCNKIYQIFADVLGTTNPLNNIKNSIENTINSLISNHIFHTQYAYDWVDDLVKNYNEWASVCTEIISQCCADENLFPFHLALAETSTTAVNNDSNYRNYFLYSTLFDTSNNYKKQLLFYAVKMEKLLSGFTIPNNADIVKPTPSNWTKTALSDRCIPYYYSTASQIHNYWNFRLSKLQLGKRNLGYFSNNWGTDNDVINPIEYDFEENDFFRIEGHIGMEINKLFPMLELGKIAYNLPFDLVAINLAINDKNSQLITPDKIQCKFKDIELLLRAQIVDFLEDLHRTICFVCSLPYIKVATEEELKSKMSSGSINLDPISISNSCFEKSNASISYSEYLDNNSSSDFSVVDYIQTYFSPAVNTVGAEFIKQKNLNVDFSSPTITSVNTLGLIKYFYDNCFYLLDLSTKLLNEIIGKELDEISLDNFKSAANKWEEDLRGLWMLGILSNVLLQKRLEEKPVDFSIFSDLQFDLFFDELELLLGCGIEEKIVNIAYENQKRKLDLAKQLTYNLYLINNTGLEHKAGVPRGGTFVLVYYSPQKTEENSTHNGSFATGFNANKRGKKGEVGTMGSSGIGFEEMAEAEDGKAFSEVVVTAGSNSPITLDNINSKSAAQGIILADFYLPYLCCGGCGSAVIVDTKKPGKEEPNIKVVNLTLTTCAVPEFDLTEVLMHGETVNYMTDMQWKDKDDLVFKNDTVVDASMITSTKKFDLIYTAKETGTNADCEVHLTFIIEKADAQYELRMKYNMQNGGETMELAAQPITADSSATYEWFAIFVQEDATGAKIEKMELLKNVSSNFKTVGVGGFSVNDFKRAEFHLMLRVTTKNKCMSEVKSQFFNRSFYKTNGPKLRTEGMIIQVK